MALHGSPIKLPNYLQSSHKITQAQSQPISIPTSPSTCPRMSKDLSMNPEIVQDKGIRY